MKVKNIIKPDLDKYGNKEGLYIRKKNKFSIEYDEEDFEEFMEKLFIIDETMEKGYYITYEEFTEDYQYFFGLHNLSSKTAIRELFEHLKNETDVVKRGAKRVGYIDSNGKRQSKTARVLLNIKKVKEQDSRNSNLYVNSMAYEKQLMDLMKKLYKDKELNFDYGLLRPAYLNLKERIDEMEKKNGCKRSYQTNN